MLITGFYAKNYANTPNGNNLMMISFEKQGNNITVSRPSQTEKEWQISGKNSHLCAFHSKAKIIQNFS